MAVEREILGYIECPWCRDVQDRPDTMATVKVNSKGKCYVVCEGGPSGDQWCCGQGNNLHARHSARLRSMLARAVREGEAKGANDGGKNSRSKKPDGDNGAAGAGAGTGNDGGGDGGKRRGRGFFRRAG